MSQLRAQPHLDRSANASVAPWWMSGLCRCGRMVLVKANEGTCLICGTGRARSVVNADVRLRPHRLPRDLALVIRDPCLPMFYDNVVPREHVPIMFGRAA